MTTYSPLAAGTTDAPETFHPRPVPRSVRSLPAVAGASWLVFTFAQGLLPEQAQPFEQTSDYVLEALFTVALLAGAAAAFALRPLGAVAARSRFAGIAVHGYGIGQGLVGLAAAHTLGLGRDALGPVFLAGLLMVVVCGVLTAVATVRHGALPKSVAVAFGAALPLSMVVGTWGPLALAALWLGVAVSVRSERGSH